MGQTDWPCCRAVHLGACRPQACTAQPRTSQMLIFERLRRARMLAHHQLENVQLARHCQRARCVPTAAADGVLALLAGFHTGQVSPCAVMRASLTVQYNTSCICFKQLHGCPTARACSADGRLCRTPQALVLSTASTAEDATTCTRLKNCKFPAILASFTLSDNFVSWLFAHNATLRRFDRSVAAGTSPALQPGRRRIGLLRD